MEGRCLLVSHNLQRNGVILEVLLLNRCRNCLNYPRWFFSMQEFKYKWCDTLYQASIFQSLPKWLLQTHLATKPEKLRHTKFLQALWEKLVDWGWQTKLAPLLGNSCSVNSLLIIQQRILSRGWAKGEAKSSLVSPSCGKAPVKNTLTLSTILLCSGTLKNKQTGFVFFPLTTISQSCWLI